MGTKAMSIEEESFEEVICKIDDIIDSLQSVKTELNKCNDLAHSSKELYLCINHFSSSKKAINEFNVNLFQELLKQCRKNTSSQLDESEKLL